MEANGKSSGNGSNCGKRRQFSSEQKAMAAKRHLQGKEEVLAVCQELGKKEFGIVEFIFWESIYLLESLYHDPSNWCPIRRT